MGPVCPDCLDEPRSVTRLHVSERGGRTGSEKETWPWTRGSEVEGDRGRPADAPLGAGNGQQAGFSPGAPRRVTAL